MIIYELIFDTLKESGIDVYAPDTHKGKCISPYVVLKKVSANQFVKYSTQLAYYDILCYAKNHTECISFMEKVKSVMKKVQFHVMPTMNETEPFFDDTVNAYMGSVEYRNYRRYEI